ncbi:MAG: ferritin family protein [Desulfovibrionaceae bacterium]|nr:ferritin family protein [Desulfovibrionaceae bacterium]
MASFVNAADVVAAAVEIERRGHSFYQSLEARAPSPQDKEFFAFMAQEELRHEKIFAAMLERIGGLPLPAGSTDEEYQQYVRDLLDSHTLFMPGSQERALKIPLHEAVQFEKDTLLFFMELERMVPDAERAVVRQCADEERKHIRMLLNRKPG